VIAEDSTGFFEDHRWYYGIRDVTAEPNAGIQPSFGDLLLLTPSPSIRQKWLTKRNFDRNLIFASEVIEDGQCEDSIG
jgi:hypothetical protein